MISHSTKLLGSRAPSQGSTLPFSNHTERWSHNSLLLEHNIIAAMTPPATIATTSPPSSKDALSSTESIPAKRKTLSQKLARKFKKAFAPSKVVDGEATSFSSSESTETKDVPLKGNETGNGNTPRNGATKNPEEIFAASVKKSMESSQPTDAKPSKAAKTTKTRPKPSPPPPTALLKRSNLPTKRAPTKRIRESPREAQEAEVVSVKMGDRLLSFLVIQLALFVVHQSKLAMYFVMAVMFYIVFYK